MSRAPSSTNLEIRIDRTACRGVGQCVLRAPGSFELDDEDRALAVVPLGDDAATLLAAARTCPNFAIEVWRGGVKVG